ncbi:hypothetical protein [Actinomadura nitritigenes]|uniref:Uncharacterized protein n=1 Tax=Actinomadura nitritigenes TaxID=134602 RepID=A0ABS3RCQ2_9ACTN|nr:hypothetical protein [Actinomadura nitritigenes]MBO2443870.1 hypothetical protein [Actinomadura nitritigenes]
MDDQIMGLGLAPHTIAIVAIVALIVLLALLKAIRQEHVEHDSWRLVSAEVEQMGLSEIQRLLRRGLMAPHPRYWQVVEEGLVGFRPRDRNEELQRQRLLQEVRLRLMP